MVHGGRVERVMRVLIERNKTAARWKMALAVAIACSGAAISRAEDVSAPVILQNFENSYQTITSRMSDVFAAGYGGIYTPPPGRAQSGNQSVGYDQYDRFDLGSAGNPTLYGTQTGLKAMVRATHSMGGLSYIDMVWNHSGFADTGTSGFAAAGGYPGFALTLQTTDKTAPGYNTLGYNAIDGDYHSAFATGDQNTRLAGLVDIAQDSNYQFIRSPVTPGDPRNIPGPVTNQSKFNGTQANVPTASNAQYYPDTSLQPISVFDPKTGEQNIKIYPFNPGNPANGTPVLENALGYLMRNTQWMVQTLGVDGFRIDAAKNMPPFVLNYLDRAVYRSSFRTLLNGQQQPIFSFSEVFTSDLPTISQYIRKDINPANPGTIGGNRDALDFPLFFAMQQNLSGNGLQNDFNGMVNASLDNQLGGAHNGSAGVKFVSSQDNGPPTLGNVAYAYTLMTPGNAVVYFNGHEFGNNRNFPQDGRGDALGGVYGNTIPTLVDLRNRYGRGNYRQDFLEKENFAFERTGAALVMLSNRTDAGYDSRTINVAFAPGTPLLEQTGNAHGAGSDPHGDIPQLLVVNADSSSPTGASVNVRFLRNSTFNLSGVSTFTGNGYLVYGLPTPTGTLAVSNVSSVMAGKTPNAGTSTNLPYDNGTTRLSNISVIKSNTFDVSLNTVQANLLGTFRDKPADGDNALIKLDGGLDLNGNGVVDNTAPNTPQYGFENFTTTHSPGYFNASGAGTYSQAINASSLADGYHYIDVIAFRHRDDNGPAVYTDFRQTIYLDRNRPVSQIDSFTPIASGVNENQRLTVESVDQLANNVHVLLDQPANLTESQLLALIGSNSQSNQTDTYTWTKDFNGLTSGNHVMTVITFKPDGNSNVQRFAGKFTSTIFGAGLGDINHDGSYTVADVEAFKNLYYSLNSKFDPAADFTADGLIDGQDVGLFGQKLRQVGADQATLNDYNAFASTVPEPTLGMLLSSGAVLLLCRRRRLTPA
jgi:alpha-amylase